MEFGIQEIRSNTYIMPLEHILNKIDNGRIRSRRNSEVFDNYDSRQDCCDYIEELVAGLPLQPFYFTALNQMAVWNVVDGQKRLDTLNLFFRRSFTVRTPELLYDCKSFSFSVLPFSLRRRLLETDVTVHLILGHYSSDERNELYNLINKRYDNEVKY